MDYPSAQGGMFDSDWLPPEDLGLADSDEERIVANDPGPEPPDSR